MFKGCFVARVAIEKGTSAELFCRFEDSQDAGHGGLGNNTFNSQVMGGFCFPLGCENEKPKEYMAPEEFSFTLTGGDGGRIHGFCRKFLPPRAKPRLIATGSPTAANSNLRHPQVLCVLSQYPWFPFYYKVLQILEQLLKQGDLLSEHSARELPLASPAGVFLANLSKQCPNPPTLGRVFRVEFPRTESLLSISPPRRVGGFSASYKETLLERTEEFVELEIPPDSGNGTFNAGIPLARLLWHVPCPALMTLIAALLRERRVILVAQDRDKVSAAVHAAAAMLYPFRWHHIYLPLLPAALKDYLTAPMPFLVGMPAQLLPALRGLPMDEVTLVDLDLGTCEPAPGSERDDARSLPWCERLQASMQVVYNSLRSPTEFESTPVIGHLMQEYFLKLIGRYRDFISPDRPAAADPARPPDKIAAQPSSALPSPPSASKLSFSKADSPLRAFAARKLPPTPTAEQDDSMLRAHGWRFDHHAFTLSHRRSEAAREFLRSFRHSQMYEVFVSDRLRMAATDFRTDDSFERKVDFLTARRSQRLTKTLSNLSRAAGAKGRSNLTSMIQKTSRMVKELRVGHTVSTELEHEFWPDLAEGPPPPRRPQTAAPSLQSSPQSQQQQHSPSRLPPAQALTPRSNGMANLTRPVQGAGQPVMLFDQEDSDSDAEEPPRRRSGSLPPTPSGPPSGTSSPDASSRFRPEFARSAATSAAASNSAITDLDLLDSPVPSASFRDSDSDFPIPTAATRSPPPAPPSLIDLDPITTQPLSDHGHPHFHSQQQPTSPKALLAERASSAAPLEMATSLEAGMAGTPRAVLRPSGLGLESTPRGTGAVGGALGGAVDLAEVLRLPGEATPGREREAGAGTAAAEHSASLAPTSAGEWALFDVADQLSALARDSDPFQLAGTGPGQLPSGRPPLPPATPGGPAAAQPSPSKSASPSTASAPAVAQHRRSLSSDPFAELVQLHPSGPPLNQMLAATAGPSTAPPSPADAAAATPGPQPPRRQSSASAAPYTAMAPPTLVVPQQGSPPPLSTQGTSSPMPSGTPSSLPLGSLLASDLTPGSGRPSALTGVASPHPSRRSLYGAPSMRAASGAAGAGGTLPRVGSEEQWSDWASAVDPFSSPAPAGAPAAGDQFPGSLWAPVGSPALPGAAVAGSQGSGSSTAASRVPSGLPALATNVSLLDA